jgi:hypothetical protein
MDAFAVIVAGFALYLAAGLVTALAFVSVGVTRVQRAPVSLGARLLLVPAATALWPFVLCRWRKLQGSAA